MKILITILFFLISFPLDAKIEVVGAQTISKESVIKASNLNDSPSEEEISQSIENLKKWGIFKKIEIEKEMGSEKNDITIKVEEAILVSEIIIKGNYPYIDNKILKRLTLRAGDIYSEKEAEEQKEKIINFYKREGFFGTKVDIQTSPSKRKGSLQVELEILKGHRFRLGSVSVEGNKHWPRGRFISILNPLKAFSERRLKNSIDKMGLLYSQAGFLKARIQASKIFNHKEKKVHIHLKISEGPHTDISFSGEKNISSRTLRKKITLYNEGNFDLIELDTSKQELEEFYTSQAYPDAKISVSREKLAYNNWKIIFNIDSGAKQYIKKIVYHGDKSFTKKNLSKIISSKKRSLENKGIINEAYIDRDKKTIELFYQTKGFLETKVTSGKLIQNKSGFTSNLIFDIDEGPQSFVSKINFHKKAPFLRAKLLKQLEVREKDAFNVFAVKADAQKLKLYYQDNGYPYAEIKQVVRSVSQTQKEIDYFIEENKKVTIGAILIVGDILSSVRAIRQSIPIKEGADFSYKKILESELALRRNQAFRSASIETIGLKRKKQIVHLVIRLEERPPFAIDLDAKYSTDAQYSGSMRFTNYNSFGWGKQTGLLVSAGIEKARAQLDWLDPRFLGSDIQFSTGGWMEYQKERAQTYIQPGGSFSFFRRFRRFGFLGRYELKRTYILEGFANNQNSLRDSTLSSVTLSTSFDTRDHFGDPKKGIFLLLGPTFTNEIGGLEDNFVKIKSSNIFYWTPLSFMTFSHTLRIDRIETLGKSITVPTSELYFLGGDDTIRGFSEDGIGPVDRSGEPVGGRTRWVYNAEVHFRLSKKIQLAGFFDVGSLANNYKDVFKDNVRESAGFGLRYITPVGPIRADYGIILDKKPSESFGRFHLTFGYPF